jgi:hypothetical protein
MGRDFERIVFETRREVLANLRVGKLDVDNTKCL